MSGMRVIRIGVFPVMLALAGLTACGTQKIEGQFQVVDGTQFDAAKVQDIADGSMSENQLVEMFGQPVSRQPDGDSETWTYHFTEAKTDETNEFMHGVKVKTSVEHFLTVGIRDGIVQKHEYREKTNKTTTENRF